MHLLAIVFPLLGPIVDSGGIGGQVSTAGRGAHAVASTTVGMGQTARINGLRLKPVAIVEDSRCPRYVSCVWRGRLVIKLAVAGRPPLTLENGKPVAIGGGMLTLADATPISGRGEKVPPNRYRFQLRFER
jgi:hypothetical protein